MPHTTRPLWIISLALIAIGLFHIAAPTLAAQDVPTQKPNVILIMTDDQGYGDLACHGNPILKTPHLDQLHSNSVRLTNFHVDPTCSPTRAALMTGRYSTRTGVWHTVMGRHMPRRDEIMMPQIFADSGYRTAIFGKWHLGDNFPFRPQDRGFHETLIHGGGGVGQIPDYWGNDYFDDTYFHNGQPQKFTGYCTDVWFNQATAFIQKNAKSKQPFFCYIATNAPHSPYRAPESYRKPYANLVDGDSDLATFYGMIANIDENVGQLRAQLKKLKLTDNTILIFMTDNGTSRGATFTETRGNEGIQVSGYNANRRGKKGSPYEGGHRVPFFIHWPQGNLIGGRDIQPLTAHIDILPTLIDLCQLTPQKTPAFDGQSFAPLLRGNETDHPPRTLFAHHQELPYPDQYRFGCVIQPPWRLILRNDLTPTPQFELYNLQSDPSQTNDLSEIKPNLTHQLRQAYDAWWKQLAPTFDNDARIVVGHNQQPITQLTCFEWQGSQRWSQSNIKRGIFDNGQWRLNIAQPGTYRIQLRRWPTEANTPINAPLPGAKAIKAIQAQLRIGQTQATTPINPTDTSADFTLRLDAGPATMQSWFYDDQGNSIGAYYATVQRIGP